MEPVISMVLLCALLAMTHIGLAANPARGPIVARVGERGFTILFSLLAAISFTVFITYYAAHRFDGPAGLTIGRLAPVRWGLMSLMVGAAGLLAASLAAYPRSPYALFSRRAVPDPRGVERITRHGFLAATAVFAVAHMLLATRLVGTVFAGGFAVLAIVGAWHQDRKFFARHGEAYAAYLAVTSTLPFGAILAGRQRLVVAELPLRTFAMGGAIAVALRLGHDYLFAWGGVGIIAALVGGAAIEGAQALRRARRQSTPPPLAAGAAHDTPMSHSSSSEMTDVATRMPLGSAGGRS